MCSMFCNVFDKGNTGVCYDGRITNRPIGGHEMDCLHYCSPGVPEVMMMCSLVPCYVACYVT
jgi:hypothetical protein